MYDPTAKWLAPAKAVPSTRNNPAMFQSGRLNGSETQFPSRQLRLNQGSFHQPTLANAVGKIPDTVRASLCLFLRPNLQFLTNRYHYDINSSIAVGSQNFPLEMYDARNQCCRGSSARYQHAVFQVPSRSAEASHAQVILLPRTSMSLRGWRTSHSKACAHDHMGKTVQ